MCDYSRQVVDLGEFVKIRGHEQFWWVELLEVRQDSWKRASLARGRFATEESKSDESSGAITI